MRLPARPILDHIHSHGGIAEILAARGWPARANGKESAAHHKIREQVRLLGTAGDLYLHKADWFCVKVLGCHPCEVYGSDWFNY